MDAPELCKAFGIVGHTSNFACPCCLFQSRRILLPSPDGERPSFAQEIRAQTFSLMGISALQLQSLLKTRQYWTQSLLKSEVVSG